MLARKYRLTKDSDFQKVFSRGKKAFSPYFLVRFQPNQLGNCRFAVVVANKIAKKAVIRNRLKRQVREAIYNNLSKFTQRLDIIVNILPACLEKDSAVIEKELVQVFKKIS